MTKLRIAVSLTAIMFICQIFGPAEAVQPENKALMEKLVQLREKKAELITKHDEEQYRLNRECENRLTSLKKEYRASHDECVRTRRENSEKMRKDFENALKPILKEEALLIDAIGRDASEDFVKTKAERQGTKK
jgi:hypothetical protein